MTRQRPPRESASARAFSSFRSPDLVPFLANVVDVDGPARLERYR